jgi:large subunit ribosomal protein L11
MKEIVKVLKFQLEAGKANAAPPLGPLLTVYNINPNIFVKEFNEKTSKEKGLRSVLIFIFNDKTYKFKLLGSPISKLILDKLNLKKGSPRSKEIIYKMNLEEFLSIFNEKKKDFPHLNSESLKKMILGTAQNMGIVLHT